MHCDLVRRHKFSLRTALLVSNHHLHSPRHFFCTRIMSKPAPTPVSSHPSVPPAPLPVGDVLTHIVDVHCHPTDSPIPDELLKEPGHKMCAMATRRGDQARVAALARAYPKRVIPAFGYHPWFAHHIWVPPDTDAATLGEEIAAKATKEDAAKAEAAAKKSEDAVEDTMDVDTSAPSTSDPPASTLASPALASTSTSPTPFPIDKSAHYRSLFRPTAAQEDIFATLLPRLPDPTPLNTILTELCDNLRAFPGCMLGEVGLDRAFRVPMGGKYAMGEDNGEEGKDEATKTEEDKRELANKAVTKTSEAPKEMNGKDGVMGKEPDPARTLSPFTVPIEHQRAVLEAQVALAIALRTPAKAEIPESSKPAASTDGSETPDHEDSLDNAKSVAGPALKDLKFTSPPPAIIGISLHSVKAPQHTLEFLNAMRDRYGDRWRALSVDLHSCGLSPEMWRTVETGHPNAFLSVSTGINLRSIKACRALITAAHPTRLLAESDWHAADESASRTFDIVRFIAEVREWGVESMDVDEPADDKKEPSASPPRGKKRGAGMSLGNGALAYADDPPSSNAPSDGASSGEGSSDKDPDDLNPKPSKRPKSSERPKISRRPKGNPARSPGRRRGVRSAAACTELDEVQEGQPWHGPAHDPQGPPPCARCEVGGVGEGGRTCVRRNH
ncbi:hypothetical protein BD626DRAFT_487260 [Schizophyllum amplum]|uniref:TatD related DNase-domain-containing protein n=1 Tax=Schizophyllum amplum TaxID=97359 RepID=A0A550CN96_9AGAR|nr:hypothetical protein BD626DRAFT_487260 [Auriculariopsis ampla]